MSEEKKDIQSKETPPKVEKKPTTRRKATPKPVGFGKANIDTSYELKFENHKRMCIFVLKDMSTPNVSGTPSDMWVYHERERHETVDAFMNMFVPVLLNMKIFEAEDFKTPMDIYNTTQMSVEEIMEALRNSDYGYGIRSKSEARVRSQSIWNQLQRLHPHGAPNMRLIKVINAPEIMPLSDDAIVGVIPKFKK